MVGVIGLVLGRGIYKESTQVARGTQLGVECEVGVFNCEIDYLVFVCE